MDSVNCPILIAHVLGSRPTIANRFLAFERFLHRAMPWADKDPIANVPGLCQHFRLLLLFWAPKARIADSRRETDRCMRGYLS